MNQNRSIVNPKPEEEIVKGMDLRIAELNNDIVEAINKANLPAGVLKYIFADYVNLMRSKEAAAVAQQQEAFEEEVKKHGKEIHKD